MSVWNSLKTQIICHFPMPYIRYVFALCAVTCPPFATHHSLPTTSYFLPPNDIEAGIQLCHWIHLISLHNTIFITGLWPLINLCHYYSRLYEEFTAWLDGSFTWNSSGPRKIRYL